MKTRPKSPIACGLLRARVPKCQARNAENSNWTVMFSPTLCRNLHIPVERDHLHMDPAFVCPLCVLGGHFVTSVFCLYALAAVPPISFRFFSHQNTASLTLSIVPCATFLAFFDPWSKISNTRFGFCS